MSTEKKIDGRMLKWIWSFSPKLWITLLALVPPFLVATVGERGLCGFIPTAVLEGCAAIIIYVGYQVWGSGLRDHTKKWWSQKPK